MVFKPGNPGRPKGSVNKERQLLADIVDKALEHPDVPSALERMLFSSNPKEKAIFWNLAGKRMPQRIEAEIGPIEIRVRTGWDAAPVDPAPEAPPA